MLKQNVNIITRCISLKNSWGGVKPLLYSLALTTTFYTSSFADTITPFLSMSNGIIPLIAPMIIIPTLSIKRLIGSLPTLSDRRMYSSSKSIASISVFFRLSIHKVFPFGNALSIALNEYLCNVSFDTIKFLIVIIYGE